MGGSSKTSNQNQWQIQNQNTTNAPWSVAQPGLQQSLNLAQQAANNTYNGSSVAAMDPNVIRGQNLNLEAAAANQPGQMANNFVNAYQPLLANGGVSALGLEGVGNLNQAAGYLNPYASGQYVQSGNPYLDAVIAKNDAATMARINSNFSSAGRYGSPAQAGTAAGAISAADNAARMGQYNTDVQNQLSAIQGLGNIGQAKAGIGQQGVGNINSYLSALPTVAQGNLFAGNTIQSVGGQNMDYNQRVINAANQDPWTKAQNLAQITGGIGQLGGTSNMTGTSYGSGTTTQKSNPGVFGDILAGVGAAANVAGMAFGVPGVGTAFSSFGQKASDFFNPPTFSGGFSGGDAPAPQNIGLLAGGPPAFTSVNPSAPAFQTGPTTVQDQYANVPLPPRRPNDLTSFQAMAPAQADPQDINAPPPGQPNSNVVGTQASGAPEITAQKSQGLGDYLGKAANLVGGIYGAGGPGDALIALGLSNRTNGASIQALNAGILNRSRQSELALKQAEANDKIKAIAGNVALVRRLYPNLSDQEISAFARNPEMMKQIGQVAAPMEQWTTPTLDDQGNLVTFNMRTREPKILQAANETVHPATPAERAQWLAPDDKTPLGISDRTGKPVGVPGGTNVAVYNAPQSTYANQGQESVGKQHIALAEGADKAQEKLMNLNAMSGALQSIREKGGTTGLGESAKTNLQSYINTMSNAVGYQPFDISDKELINKIGRLLSANAAKDAQGSRVTNFELDNFLKANPGLELSPQGNERLLGIMQQIEKRKVDLGTELQDRFAAGKPPSIAENHEFVKKYISEHHIIDPTTGQDITANPKLPDFGNRPVSSSVGSGETGKPFSFTVIEAPRR